VKCICGVKWPYNRVIGKVAMSGNRACSSFRLTDNSSKWIECDPSLLKPFSRRRRLEWI
jgi:hypothetical protein